MNHMPADRKTTAASLAALTGALAASSCCLPFGTLLAVAGTAGASVLLDTARPWLIPLSAILITYGFYQMYAPRVARPLWSQSILWASAAMVLVMTLFPQQVAIFVAGISSNR